MRRFAWLLVWLGLLVVVAGSPLAIGVHHEQARISRPSGSAASAAVSVAGAGLALAAFGILILAIRPPAPKELDDDL